MGDKIDNLPIDSTSSSPKSDIDIILNVFKPTEGGGGEPSKVVHEFKSSIIGGTLFLILSSPIVDKIIRSAGFSNDMYVWFTKFLVFVILFYILKNRF